MDYNVQEPTTTPKRSQRQFPTERAVIEFETDMDSEPSGQLHRDREGRGSMRHGSPSTTYKHNVRLFNELLTRPSNMELVCINFFSTITDSIIMFDSAEEDLKEEETRIIIS